VLLCADAGACKVLGNSDLIHSGLLRQTAHVKDLSFDPASINYATHHESADTLVERPFVNAGLAVAASTTTPHDRRTDRTHQHVDRDAVIQIEAKPPTVERAQ
jgi:hypothetical protein